MNPQGVVELMKQVDPTQLALYLPLGITSFVFIILAFAFGPSIKSLAQNSRNKKILQERGQRTTALIMSVQDTGITVNNVNYYVKVTVQTVPGSQATFNMLVNRTNIPRPGDAIEVLYDPANPTIAVKA